MSYSERFSAVVALKAKYRDQHNINKEASLNFQHVEEYRTFLCLMSIYSIYSKSR